MCVLVLFLRFTSILPTMPEGQHFSFSTYICSQHPGCTADRHESTLIPKQQLSCTHSHQNSEVLHYQWLTFSKALPLPSISQTLSFLEIKKVRH